MAVPDVDPRVGRAYFVNEPTGAVLGSTPLTRRGRPTAWPSGTTPPRRSSVPINAARIGVRVALGGGSSTTCGEPLVECYDLASRNGIAFVRGWSATGSGRSRTLRSRATSRLFAALAGPVLPRLERQLHDRRERRSRLRRRRPGRRRRRRSPPSWQRHRAAAHLRRDLRAVGLGTATYFGVAPGAGPVRGRAQVGGDERHRRPATTARRPAATSARARSAPCSDVFRDREPGAARSSRSRDLRGRRPGRQLASPAGDDTQPRRQHRRHGQPRDAQT